MSALSGVTFPQAAGVTGMLTAAGLASEEIHYWFGRPREELDWLSPAQAVRLSEPGDGTGQLVLELAQRDAQEAARWLPAGWEGSD